MNDLSVAYLDMSEVPDDDIDPYEDAPDASLLTGGVATTGATTALPIYTNDQIAAQIDRANAGTSVHFNVRPGGTLTYNVSTLTADGKTLAREALAVWSDVTGIKFGEVASGGQISFVNTDSGAFTSTSYSGKIILSAKVNVSTDWIASYGTAINSYSFQTYLHEIGHALGLVHAGNYNGSATYSTDALFQNDSWSTTVMSYFSDYQNSYFANQGFTYQYDITPTVADALATTALYGARTAVRTGDTVYGVGNTSGRAEYDAANAGAQVTIYDDGGTDTLNYSGFSQNQLINLNAESFSNVAGHVGNLSIGRGVVIENAIGGSGDDVLIANAAVNQLTGGAGADTFRWLSYGDSTASARDTITDFTTHVDRIDVSALGASQLTVAIHPTVAVSGDTATTGFAVTSIVSASDGGANTLQLAAAGAVAMADIADGGTATALRQVAIYDHQDHLASVTGYSAANVKLYTDTYTAGLLAEQAGYDASGAVTIDIRHASDGTTTVRTFAAGIVTGQSGYAADGHLVWSNAFAAGRLMDQTGYDTNGAVTIRIHHNNDGSSLVASYAGGQIAGQAGYASDGHIVWQDTYVGTRLSEQDGFDNAGAKILEIDHPAEGGSVTSHFAAGALLDRAAFDAAGTLQYATVQNGAGGYIVTSGTGAQTLSVAPGPTTFRYTDVTASSASAYDVLTDFRSGIDHVDLSQVAFGEVSIRSNGNGWTSIFFASSQLGDIAVHGSVAATDLILGAGAHLTIG